MTREVSPGLASLLAPVTPAQFVSEYWQQRALHVMGASGRLPAAFQQLARSSVADLLSGRSEPIAVNIRTTLEQEVVEHCAPEAALAAYRADQRATLYWVKFQEAFPEFGSWATALARDLGISHEGTAVASLFASRLGGGLPFHFDKNENFVVQLVGSKRWRVGTSSTVDRPTVNFGEDPLAELPLYDSRATTPAREWAEFELQPGDVLYVPRGHWHRTEAQSEESISLSLTLVSVTWADALLPFIRRLLIQDPGWRRHALVSAQQPHAVAELKARLAELPQALSGLRAQPLLGEQSTSFARATAFRRNPLAALRTELRRGEPVVSLLVPTLADICLTEFSVSSQLLPVVEWIASAAEFSLAELEHAHPRVLPGELRDLLRVGYDCGLLQGFRTGAA